MIGNLDRSQQRKAALGLLFALIVVTVALIAIPVWRLNRAYAAEIDYLQTRIASLRERATADEALRPQYERLIRAHAASAHHLKSDTEAVAAADLQGIVKSIAAANTTQILTTQIIQATEEQAFVRVGLRVRVRGPLEGIVQTLYDIEANPTFLFIDKLSIRDAARRRVRGAAESNQFDGDFDVVAYMPEPMQ